MQTILNYLPMVVFLITSTIVILAGWKYKSLVITVVRCIFVLIGLSFNKVRIEIEIALVLLTIVFLVIYMQKTSVSKYIDELQNELNKTKNK